MYDAHDAHHQRLRLVPRLLGRKIRMRIRLAHAGVLPGLQSDYELCFRVQYQIFLLQLTTRP